MKRVWVGPLKTVVLRVKTCLLPPNFGILTTLMKTLKLLWKSLLKTRLDYVDLYLIHWPNPNLFEKMMLGNNAMLRFWAMEDMLAAGKVRAIGISNFLPHHLRPSLKQLGSFRL